MSKGIVRCVYLAGVGAAAIEHLQTRISYGGAYPTAPLADAAAGPFVVAARVHFRAPAAGASGCAHPRHRISALASPSCAAESLDQSTAQRPPAALPRAWVSSRT